MAEALLIRDPPAAAPRRPYFIGFAITTFGTGLVFPLNALFLSSVGHFHPSQVGAYFATTAASALLVNPIAGSQSQRRGPFPVFALAVSFQALAAAIMLLAHVPAAFFAAAIVGGLGNGAFYAVQTSMIIRLFGRDTLGQVFGTQYLIMNAAVGVGALLAGQLVQILGPVGYRLAYAGNGVSFLIFGVLIWIIGRGRGRVDVKSSAPDQAVARPGRLPALEPYRRLSFAPLLLLQFALVAFGFAQVEAVLPVVLREAGNLKVPLITGSIALNAVVVVAVQRKATAWCSHRAPSRGLAIACGLWLLAVVPGYVATSVHKEAVQVVALALFTVLFAAGETFISPTLQPLVVSMAPENSIGVYTAAVSLMFSVGLMLGPVVALPVFGTAGAGGYWLLLTGGFALALVLLQRISRYRRPDAMSATK